MCLCVIVDRMTLLGPRPVIASLSLGATRTFRLKKAVNSKSQNSNKDNGETQKSEASAQISTPIRGTGNTSCSQEASSRSQEPDHAAKTNKNVSFLPTVSTHEVCLNILDFQWRWPILSPRLTKKL